VTAGTRLMSMLGGMGRLREERAKFARANTRFRASGRMRNVDRWMALGAWILGGMASGCYRSGPPVIPEFRPPPKRVLKGTTALETADRTPEPVRDQPEPEPEPEPNKAKPVAAPVPEPEAEPEPEEFIDEVPPIYGKWRVTEMSRNGQVVPQPEGMEMVVTILEDGTLTMSTSVPQMPEPRVVEGTWEIDGDRITLSMGSETLSGTYTFDGDDNVTLDLGVMQVALTRG